MKRSFAYFLIAAVMSALLCGCGMEDGIIYDNPTPTQAVTPMPTLRPEVSPESTNDANTANNTEPGRNGPGTDGSSSVAGTSDSTSSGSNTTQGSTGTSDSAANRANNNNKMTSSADKNR